MYFEGRDCIFLYPNLPVATVISRCSLPLGFPWVPAKCGSPGSTAIARSHHPAAQQAEHWNVSTGPPIGSGTRIA